MPRYVHHLLCAAACIVVMGCGGKPARPLGIVRGNITVSGKPLTQGTVVYDNSSMGVTTMSAVAEDGSYTVRTHAEAGLPPGKYRVAVIPQGISSGDTPLAGSAPKQPIKPPATIPEKYRTLDGSPLTADVKEGNNPPFDFDLTP